VATANATDVLSGLRHGPLELEDSGLHLEEVVDSLVNGTLSAALFLGAARLLSRASRDTVGYGANAIGLVFLVVAVAPAIRLERAIRTAEKENDSRGADKSAWIEHTHAHGEGGTGTLGVDGRRWAEGKN
jgi:hypothetical protein